MNLEEDEAAFYDIESPEKIIINYDKTADPALKYKLDKKPLRSIPEGLDLEELVTNMDSLADLLNQYKRSDESLTQILDDYLASAATLLEDEADETKEEDTDDKKDVPADDDDEKNPKEEEKSTPRLRPLKKKV